MVAIVSWFVGWLVVIRVVSTGLAAALVNVNAPDDQMLWLTISSQIAGTVLILGLAVRVNRLRKSPADDDRITDARKAAERVPVEIERVLATTSTPIDQLHPDAVARPTDANPPATPVADS